MVTAAKNWKKKQDGAGVQHEVSLPSGNVCLCIRPPMDTFIRLGVLPVSMMGLVDRMIGQAKKTGGVSPTQEKVIDSEVEKLIADPQKMAEMLDMADKVVAYVVQEPKILLPPELPETRDNSALYTDEIDLDDKMHLLNWAFGGDADLASFSGRPASGVAAVRPRKTVAKKAQRVRKS